MMKLPIVETPPSYNNSIFPSLRRFLAGFVRDVLHVCAFERSREMMHVRRIRREMLGKINRQGNDLADYWNRRYCMRWREGQVLDQLVHAARRVSMQKRRPDRDAAERAQRHPVRGQLIHPAHIRSPF